MNNLTIKARLMLVIGFLSLLVIAIGSSGLWSLSRSSQSLRNVHDNNLLPIGQIGDVRLRVLHIRTAITTGLTYKEEIPGQHAEIEQDIADIQKQWGAYMATYLTPEEKKLAANFSAEFDKCLDQGVRQAMKLQHDKRWGEAERFYWDQVRPLCKPVTEEADSLLQLQRDLAKTEYEANIGRYATNRALTLTFVPVCLILVIYLGWAMIRSLNRSTNQAYGYIKEMTEGNLNVDVRMETRDEISKILLAVSQLRGKLASDLDEARNTASELEALVQQTQKSIVEVGNSVTEIAATSKEQEATAVEVAATATEVSATSKEISATSRELVKTMGDVAMVAEHSASLASSGQAGLVHMEEIMHQVMEASGSINAKLSVLNEKADNIGHVTTTITKVADQTNLLSLNAAIEAEKAGEYGRGFAIVATEIRRLADQTAVASYDIELMVKEIQSAVSASVMGMDKFSEEVRRGIEGVQQVSGSLSQVIEQVQTLAPRFEGVNEGMQAQAHGAEQITDALAQLSEASQQTVETLRQSNQAIANVNLTMHDLSDSVSRYQTA
jgi:methyl-accepting chemotaxis protein WspA